VTEQMDLYLGVVVSLMFLAGCFVIAIRAHERSEERKRLQGSTATKPRLPQKASHDEPEWKSRTNP
jgi:hypothetical protein